MTSARHVNTDARHSGGAADQTPAQMMTPAPAEPSTAPAPAPPPTAPAGAGYIGALCALSLIALGVVAVHDGIAAVGWIASPRWTQTAVNWIDGQSFHPWMIPIAAAAVLVGLAFVAVAIKPRRKRAVALTARTSVYLDLSDVARVAAAAARAVPGVVDATARARRRKVTIRARTTGADPAAQRAAVTEAVGDALAPLATTPKIRVRTSIGKRR
jgi:NADH:ubiquinone oxidoreductase subunit K